jgi:hypothetical protein
MSDIQTLMTKNRTLAITDPMEFVSNAFQVSRASLEGAITVHQSGTGFFALVDHTIFDTRVVRKGRQTSDVSEGRCQIYKLKHRRLVYEFESGWSGRTFLYSTGNDDIIPLLLHLLMK